MKNTEFGQIELSNSIPFNRNGISDMCFLKTNKNDFKNREFVSTLETKSIKKNRFAHNRKIMLNIVKSKQLNYLVKIIKVESN